MLVSGQLDDKNNNNKKILCPFLQEVRWYKVTGQFQDSLHFIFEASYMHLYYSRGYDMILAY